MSAERVHNPCPHCGASARRRSGRQVTATVFVGYYQCSDVECSAAWAAQTEITHLISQSGKPNPRVAIPYRPVERRRITPPAAANDVAPSGTALAN